MVHERFEIKSLEATEKEVVIELVDAGGLTKEDYNELVALYRDFFSCDNFIIRANEKDIAYEGLADKREETPNEEESYLSSDASSAMKALLERQKVLDEEFARAATVPFPLKEKEEDPRHVFGPKITKKPKEIEPDIDLIGKKCYEGEVFGYTEVLTKNNNLIVTFSLVGEKRGVAVKFFVSDYDKPKNKEKYKTLKNGAYVMVYGELKPDSYDSFRANDENTFFATSIALADRPAVPRDGAKDKRIEFKMHSDMTQMSGVNTIQSILKRVAYHGHRGICLTDEDVVQNYPKVMELMKDAKKNGYPEDFKVVYGLDCQAEDYSRDMVYGAGDRDFDTGIVIFDIETTGINKITDEIIEIAAQKIEGGELVSNFSSLVSIGRPIPYEVTQLTGIDDRMLKGAPTIEEVLPKFLEYCKDSIVCAHNAEFDVLFVKKAANILGLEFNPPVLDSLVLSRLIYPEFTRHGLADLSKKLKVSLVDHHRADNDVSATRGILLAMFDKLRSMGIPNFKALNSYARKAINLQFKTPKRYTLLLKEQDYIPKFYELVSDAHINHFYKRPNYDESKIYAMREGLLIGSGGIDGEVFMACFLGYSDDIILEIIKKYDYIEIEAPSAVINKAGSFKYGSSADYVRVVNKVIALSKIVGVPCVAVSNAYYLDRADKHNHNILKYGDSGFRSQRERRAQELKDNMTELHLRTTNEMLSEFSFLGDELCYEIVVCNPDKLFDLIPKLQPIPSGTFPPIIEGSAEELRSMCYRRASELYGDVLPDIVSERLDKELGSIIKNGYAVMYIVAQKLVIKSNQDGYLVGSRGSVGSSFVATMAGITEVNPLPPHYYCESKPCHYVEFYEKGDVLDGFDLPEKNCPVCGKKLISDGHNIPFETFLGFEGEKEPDIDLNFASTYQHRAHQYTAVLFGDGYVYKAGTISTVKDKKAYAYIKDYDEQFGLGYDRHFINKQASILTGCKNTTGQHPGGIMVVPSNKSIYDFTPIQYPANDIKKGTRTTHFDYHSISGRILKLDILAHEAPTIIKRLEELTGFSAANIAFNDRPTMKVFSNNESLNIVDPSYEEKSGALGIPEFGTFFVRGILRDTKPQTFVELAKICGVAHGTNVWNNNAEVLIKSGIATLMEAICVRDEIMTYLIRCGVNKSKAFDITEKVRKGKGLTPEFEEIMRENHVPEWYIDSCKKISYMFPLAHAVAYVMMSFRIAFYKVYYPLAFYASYFSSNIEDFDAELILRGKDAITEELKRNRDSSKDGKRRDGEVYLLELAREMMARGFEFLPCDVMESEAEEFSIKDGKLLMPLRAADGFGSIAAKNFVEYRKTSVIYSIADINKSDGLTKKAVESLRAMGSLADYPEGNQFTIDMFLN